MKTFVNGPFSYVVGIHFPDPETRQLEYEELLSFGGPYKMEYSDVDPSLARNSYLYILFLSEGGCKLYWRDTKLDYTILSLSEYVSIHYTELKEGSYRWSKEFQTAPRKLIATVKGGEASVKYNHGKQFIVPVSLLIEEGWIPRYSAGEYGNILKTFTKNT